MTINYCKECMELYKPKDDKIGNKICYHKWFDEIRPTIDKLYRKNLIQYKQRKKRIREAKDI